MNDVTNTTKAIAEIVKAVPLYEDAVQPVAKEIGKSLKTVGGVINVALAPLAALVFGYNLIAKELQARLEKKLSTIPPENIVSPPLAIVGPLIERYKYLHDSPDLSEMFINLLANAMDKETIKKAHPSFVQVISELSPDEAKLLKEISESPVLPKLDIKFKDREKEGYIFKSKNFTLLGQTAKDINQDLRESYISNLERLGIIACSDGSFGLSYAEKTHYESLKNHKMIVVYKKEADAMGRDIVLQEGVIEITGFGRLFIEAVLKKA